MSTGWFAGFPHWTPEQIAADASAARSEFRARRLGEPVERYLTAFDASHPHLAALIGALRTALAGGADGGQLLKQLWASEEGRTAFRYLGAPPISEDDLETLAETRFNAAATGDVKGRLERLLAVMRAIVDPRRFPWVAENVVVRLDDGRLLAIECKGSNSEINSRKRLNKEAVQNARAWLQGFGSQQVVPAVALQGVFNPRYVIDAQNTPMAVFWAHRLDDLRRAIAPDR